VIIQVCSIAEYLFKSSFAGPPSHKESCLLPLFSGFQLNFPHKKTFSRAKGYTLIELIVVLVLIGLMLVLVVPKFRQAVLSDSLDATALRIIGLVQDLRERAISNQVSYKLHLDIRGKKLWAFASMLLKKSRKQPGNEPTSYRLMSKLQTYGPGPAASITMRQQSVSARKAILNSP